MRKTTPEVRGLSGSSGSGGSGKRSGRERRRRWAVDWRGGGEELPLFLPTPPFMASAGEG